MLAIQAVALVALACLAAAQTTYPTTFVGQKEALPALPSEDFLDRASLLAAVDDEPAPDGMFDCLSDFCGPPGAFLDVVVGRCNASLVQMDLNYALTGASAADLLANCICGSTDDEAEAISAAWKGCMMCLSSRADFVRSTALPLNAFTDACRCADPGPLPALLRLGDSSFRCRKFRPSNGSPRRPPAALPSSASSSASTFVSATASATASAATSSATSSATRTI